MSEEGVDESPQRLEIEPPRHATVQAVWRLIAYNKSVLRGWEYLARNFPKDAEHCYDWLSQHAMRPRGTRCFALKGKQYAGCWCYEISAGNRVYYKPNEASQQALIYYAGDHPKGNAPVPPKGI